MSKSRIIKMRMVFAVAAITAMFALPAGQAGRGPKRRRSQSRYRLYVSVSSQNRRWLV